MEGLVNTGLGVEGEAGVDLGGDLSGDDVEDLLAKLDQQAVEGIVNLLLNVGGALFLGVGNGDIDQLGVLGLLGGNEDQRRVGGGILGLVFANGGKVARVGDDNGAGGLELVERGRHGGCVRVRDVYVGFNETDCKD